MDIREMRSKLGITQGEFAARYNIPFRTIQNWETGSRKPPEYIIDLLE
jgi:putative transcriptional regulator